MVVPLKEMKTYLRVDYDDEDSLIKDYMKSAEQICMEILRTEEQSVLKSDRNGKVAVMYTVAYFFEHREEADFQELKLTLRALLSDNRREGF